MKRVPWIWLQPGTLYPQTLIAYPKGTGYSVHVPGSDQFVCHLRGTADQVRQKWYDRLLTGGHVKRKGTYAR